MSKPVRKQLALEPARAGRMGSLCLDRDYLAGVKARAAMLAKATRWRQPSPLVEPDHGR